MQKKLIVLATALVLLAAAPMAFAEIYTDPDTGKSYEIVTPNVIDITCEADLAQTAPFVCNGGVPGDLVPGANVGLPDNWNYHRACCEPGTAVSLQVNRLDAATDMFALACEGDQCGQSNDGWDFAFPGSCQGGAAPLGRGDDELPEVCTGPGPFSDPTMEFTCPDSGVFTMAAGNWEGGNSGTDYEAHCDGCIDADPATGACPTPGGDGGDGGDGGGVPSTTGIGVVVMILLLLGSSAYFLRRKATN